MPCISIIMKQGRQIISEWYYEKKKDPKRLLISPVGLMILKQLSRKKEKSQQKVSATLLMDWMIFIRPMYPI